DFLIDRADAERLRFRDGCGRNRLALKHDRTVETVIGAGQYLDERGFARAVFAEQRVNFPTVEREIDMIERGHAQKGFRDRAGFKKRCCSHGILPFARCKWDIRANGISGPRTARMTRISSRGPSWL